MTRVDIATLGADGTIGGSGGSPLSASVISGTSPTAVYMTALDASFQAFLNRIPASGTGVIPASAGTVSLANSLTISQSCNLRFETGAKLQKSNTFSDAQALLVSGSISVQIDAPVGTVVLDGNQAGGATGFGILVQSGASLVTRGGVIQNNKTAGLKATGPGTDVRCYGTESSSNSSGSHTADGFECVGGAKLRTWECIANNNDRYGFFFDVASAPGCRLDGYATGNQQGASIRSFRGNCGQFICEDNSNGGLAVEFGGGSWEFGEVRPLNNGFTAANASAFGVELFGASNCQFGKIVERGDSGYGLAITKNSSPITTTISNGGSSITAAATTIPSTSLSVWPQGGVITIDSETILYTGVSGNTFTGCVRGAFGTTAATHADGATITQSNIAQNNSFGVVECNNLDAWDSDPAVHISGGSTRNHIDVLDVHGRTFALSYGEGAGAANDNTVGLLQCDTISFAIWRITNGSNNRVGEIVARDCWTSNTGIADALLYFSAVDSGAATTGNVCGSFKHRTIARPSPNATIALHSGANGCYIETPGVAAELKAWAPSGIICESFSRRERTNWTSDQATALTSGQSLFVGGFVIPAGVQTASATFYSGATALTMGTNNDGHIWAVLVRQSDFVVLAASADGGGGATWAAHAAKTFTWTSTDTNTTWANYTPAIDTPVWVALMINFGTLGTPTMPTLTANSYGNVQSVIRALTPVLVGTGATGLTTPYATGTVLGAPTNSSFHPYATLQ